MRRLPLLTLLALSPAAVAGGGGGTIGGLGIVGRGDYTPPPPPPPIPEERVLHRIGDPRWSLGGAIYAMAGDPDGQELLLAGPEGAARFDAATGALLARVSTSSVTAVGYTPAGQAAWVESGGALRTADSDRRRYLCGATVGSAVGLTAQGHAVVACHGELQISSDAERPRSVELPEVAGFTLSPDGRTLVAWSRRGAGVQLPVGEEAPHRPLDDVRFAAFGPDGRLAVVRGEGIEVDGRPLRVKRLDQPREVAWSADGLLAVADAESVHLVDSRGRTRCAAPARGRSLTWTAGHLWWLAGDATTPARLDPESCVVERTTHHRTLVHALPAGDHVVTADTRTLVVWDLTDGRPVASAELPRGQVRDLARSPDSRLLVGADGPAVAWALSLPQLSVLDAPPDTLDHLARRYATLSLDGGYTAPTTPQVALASTGAVAAGLQDLHIRDATGALTVYDLSRQVHYTSHDPRVDRFGGLGGRDGDRPRREVRSGWDPRQVRPKDLALVGLAWSGAGHRLAMGWEFSVDDAYGDRQVRNWLGVLDPARTALAGMPISGRILALAQSEDGQVVAWAGRHEVGVIRLPSPAPPADPSLAASEPGPVAPEPPGPEDGLLGLLLHQEQQVHSLLGSLGEPAGGLDVWGGDPGTLGGDASIGTDRFGLGGPASVAHGEAQRLEPEGRWTVSLPRGRAPSVALSGEGELLAASAGSELRIWRVGDRDPRHAWDTGQGPVVGLRFEGRTLWVASADGSVLALDLEDR